MLKSITGTAKRSAEENPYVSGRRVWNSHTGSVVAALRAWQVVGILSLAIALAAVGGLIHIGSQSKFIPYLVHVDQTGQSVAQGPIPSVSKNDARIVRAAVADFVSRARMVSPDATLQRNAVLRVYALLKKSDPATQKMTDWFRGEQSDPFVRAEREMVEVTIKSILQQTPETWQVEWLEMTRDRQGSVLGEMTMRSLVTVYQAEPSPDVTEEVMRQNPTGIYVRDFSWSRIL